MLTSEQFLKHLRDALNHLYDPDRLRRNPLATVFGVAGRFDTPSALQRILTDAIESLKPQADQPSHAHRWQVYDLLLYRYVQQFSQREVANQLGMSVRHLRREQRAALEALAYHLWEQLGLEEKLPEGMVSEQADWPAGAEPALSEELAWLKDAPPNQHTDLAQTLQAVLELTGPMAIQHGVHRQIDLAADLPILAVHPVAVRQALLNLITVAIHRAAGGQVVISTRPTRWEAEVRLEAHPAPGSEQVHAPDARDEEASLGMASQLARLCGCELVISGQPFSATLVLPALEQMPVLAIDDNLDAIQLMQRYTVGTRYRLVGAQDLEQALSQAERCPPCIIVLDVMMPTMDGWEVLGRLRQHPLTHSVPIIVCTILAQEELALSLGASGFLHKPITRQAFLTALDRQARSMEPASR